jgi:hypothetical protein
MIAVWFEEIGDRVLGDEGGDRCLVWGKGDRVLGDEGRSLFGVGKRRSGGDRCLMWRNRRSGGDRCLMWRNRRSGFVGGEGAIAV